jgi:hypothetical protein
MGRGEYVIPSYGNESSRGPEHTSGIAVFAKTSSALIHVRKEKKVQ